MDPQYPPQYSAALLQSNIGLFNLTLTWLCKLDKCFIDVSLFIFFGRGNKSNNLEKYFPQSGQGYKKALYIKIEKFKLHCF